MPAAQIPSATGGEFLSTVLGIIGIMYFVNLCVSTYRAYVGPPKKAGEEYVTFAQFEKFEAEMQDKLTTFMDRMEAKIGSSGSEANKRLEKMETYMHEASHRNNNVLNRQAVALAELNTMIRVKFGMAAPPQSQEHPDEE